MVKKWEAPLIVAVSGLPKALGDCISGSTDGATTGGQFCGCHNGQDTIGADDVRATAITVGVYHGCSSGGIPSSCFCGETADSD